MATCPLDELPRAEVPAMKTLTVAELKARFSEVLGQMAVD
jgi:hypothetical protein